MAQLDAAVDNKQSVNHELGKNLIGSIYPPELVIVDPEFLVSLPLRHMRSGMAEAIKHALTQSESFLGHLVEIADSFTEAEVLESTIAQTVRMKIKLLNGSDVINDEEAQLILQYGHCIGHALESATGYGLLHGEAIAIGMCVTAEIAYRLGLCRQEMVIQHYRVLRRYGLPTEIPSELETDAIVQYLGHDKYRIGDSLRLVVLEDIGKIHLSRAGEKFIRLKPDTIAALLADLRPKPGVRGRN